MWKDIKYKSGATKICVSKKNADGRVVVIETVSKSHGSIEFKNMIGVSDQKYAEKYAPQNKSGNSTNTGGSGSSNTSPRDETVSNASISQSSPSVKHLLRKRADSRSKTAEFLSNSQNIATKCTLVCDTICAGGKKYAYNNTCGGMRGYTFEVSRMQREASLSRHQEGQSDRRS